MYTVRAYRLKNPRNVESELHVEDLRKAQALADATFEATTQTVEVIDGKGIIVYTMMTPKNAFDRATPKTRERALMETAMRIMDVYGEMVYSQYLSPDKLDSVDYMEKLQLFTTWALEYEEEFFETDDYENNYLDHTEKVFIAKLKSEFGSEEN
ncbi:MAG: hypothetical protein J6I68_11340 [Butyrivibrio sp.]|uniref:hypothetical protein n=1 Tax=Butyrivibrio sp. TaxID=28121 RepID=UPI001B78E298|nr:hypothetical protein [Butyrivibrio sp.]MBP3783829.1 hypothetical protein [Butyrivibrio sp.]